MKKVLYLVLFVSSFNVSAGVSIQTDTSLINNYADSQRAFNEGYNRARSMMNNQPIVDDSYQQEQLRLQRQQIQQEKQFYQQQEYNQQQEQQRRVQRCLSENIAYGRVTVCN